MIGVIVAFRNEIGHYLKSAGLELIDGVGNLRIHGSARTDDVIVVEGAVGRAGAREASEELLKRHKVDLVISAGFAGGVAPGVQAGDRYLCDRLMAVEGPAAIWDPASVLERPVPVDPVVAGRLADRGVGFVTGPCLSVPHLIPTTAMKRWIGETFSTDIIDMESYWVAEAMAARGVPVWAARCVLDTIDQVLPEFVGGVVNVGKSHGLNEAIKYLARRPGDAANLLRLAGHTRTADESLSMLLSNMIDCLAAEPVAAG